MTKTDAIKLSVVPFLLLCLALSIAFSGETLFRNLVADVREEKFAELIDKVESGVLRPNAEQIVAFLKISKNAEHARREHENSIRSFSKSLALLIATLGLIEIGVIFSLHKNGQERMSSQIKT